MLHENRQRPSNFFYYAMFFLIGAFLAGTAGWWLKGDLAFVTPDAAGAWLTKFWGRFQVMFIIAVLIERSVEVYLNATQQNGAEFYDTQKGVVVKTRDAKQPAMVAALVLSMLVAISGVRLIETLVDWSSADFLKSAFWYGIDIIVSAGLMAGGSDLFHDVTRVITSGLDRVRSNLRGETRDGIPPRVDAETFRTLTSSAAASETAIPALGKTYTITITRPAAPVEEGTLGFTDGGVTINAKCWWDKDNRIDSGTYTGCSKTHMANLGYEAIYLPDAVSKVTGAKEIFVHRGASPNNSNGCFAVETALFGTLWTHIKPMNGKNITVVVKDA